MYYFCTIFMIRFRINSELKQRSIAWVLLLVFSVAMTIKSVHCHKLESNTIQKTAVTTHYQTSVESDTYCPICQYVFSPNEGIKIFHFFFFVVLLSIHVCFLILFTSQRKSFYCSLRAPPLNIAY